MLLLGHAAVSIAASILVASTSPSIDQPNLVPAPALQVIVGYGKLAGKTCFGKASPPGSSCQLPLTDLGKELGLDSEGSSLTKGEFNRRINELEFQWPLKPYGINEKSMAKTSVINKGAETAYYMDEIERRGMYDRRNPTGPLPTSLRPKLNTILNREGIGDDTSNVIFGALAGDFDAEQLTQDELKRTFEGRSSIDYYGFLDLVGNKNINWPKYASD
mmetsp:Transcript_31927/g.67124  ORF Transcript_31927/g.67124 Transcript_31927/m.67124 type:complete len:218 (-) Transcript_31927:91-744(-)|eukprot:CAMPEP_0172300004 /NCGR_PEP_ID=MMETSP1058-20130122/2186_1 /TAXON_ID=83371 /ORGANISM="Detonula confervacea, Strain CCMP 353" /LENGTH=217 /DNA_ID=CAMNT_0013009651 /DNA_START=46 /DNA_END=699 /DNA_ORIENTATION=+